MDIRIAIDFGQQGEEGVPVKVSIVEAETDRPISVFSELRSRDAVAQPFLLKDGGGRVFIEDGGKYKALFAWKASDGQERQFSEEFEIPQPPICPACEQRVPDLNEDDYICADCRFGSTG